jgi:hypothetical protein
LVSVIAFMHFTIDLSQFNIPGARAFSAMGTNGIHRDLILESLSISGSRQ